MRIKNRRKFIENISILILIIITAIICITHIATHPKYNEKIIDYTVSSKERLWDIAEQYKKENQDIREYIYEITKLNNMDSATIYPGQVLKIIIYEEVK